jgi:hypothetical protein
MEPRHVSALSDEDLLLLWVGRVAREHARLEYGLSNVRSMLMLRRREGRLAASLGQRVNV